MLGIHRMLLHAERLAFAHPHGSGEIVAFAPLDSEFTRAVALFDISQPEAPADAGSHPP
jgi:tRNA pseudouridine65 synthase